MKKQITISVAMCSRAFVQTLNSEAITAMTLYRRNQPIIVTHLGGAKRVIDGNHRLYRRRKENCISTEVVEVAPSNLREFSEPFMSMHRRDKKNWESLFEYKNAYQVTPVDVFYVVPFCAYNTNGPLQKRN